MLDYANICQIKPAQTGNDLPDGVLESADSLACLLTDTHEFQEFLRTDRALRIDPEGTRMRDLLNDPDGCDLDPVKVQACLEALPASQAYAQSRKVIREVVGAVERIISQAAGLPFAENASVDGPT